MTDEYEEFQTKLRGRRFGVGWRDQGSMESVVHHWPTIYDSWHEANQMAVIFQKDHPNQVHFVEPVTETEPCRCDGDDPECFYCDGRGIVRTGTEYIFDNDEGGL